MSNTSKPGQSGRNWYNDYFSRYGQGVSPEPEDIAKSTSR